MKERSAALSKVGETCRGRFIAPIADLSASRHPIYSRPGRSNFIASSILTYGCLYGTLVPHFGIDKGEVVYFRFFIPGKE